MFKNKKKHQKKTKNICLYKKMDLEMSRAMEHLEIEEN